MPSVSDMAEGFVLPENDVRGIVRLLGEVIAMRGNINVCRRRLMDGLCQLISADVWVWCMAEFDPRKPPSFLGLLHGGFTEKRFARYIEAINHPDMERISRPQSEELQQRGTHLTRTQKQLLKGSDCSLEASAAYPAWVRADIDVIMTSLRPMPGGGVSGVGVYRNLGRSQFGEREARICHILLSEVPWLHFQSFPGQEGREITRLFPRHRTVLNCLCEGWGRKKIADYLGISENTVNEYVKTVFLHFQVHSQAELIARVSTGDGGDRFQVGTPS
ncbi:MAG: helix-turn-helix transcriptional regulator [Akkermansiaceae bacterium]|nr:helix-turn-helix transcriptional regulator [Akkermansiaceae bacterium]